MSEYIKREDVKEQLLSYFVEEFRKSDTGCTIGIALYAINAVPAADVEPVVRGEWVGVKKITTEATVRCSVCGNLISAWYKTKRCAECGAHMERSGEQPDGICTGCKKLRTEICDSCMRNGHGNDVDFYDSGRGAE